MVVDSTPSSSEGEIRDDAIVVPDEETEMLAEAPNAERRDGPARHEKREAAKNAIRQLYDHDIGFQELVDEAIDAGLLQELYQELELTLSFQGQARAPKPAPSLSQRDQHVFTSSPQPSLPSSQMDVLPKSSGVARPPPLEIRSEGKLSPDFTSESLHFGDQPQAEARATPKPNKPASHALPIKPIERKDYIARLLAAKQAVRQQSNPKADNKASSKSPTFQRQIREDSSEGGAPLLKDLTLDPTEGLSDPSFDSSADMKKPETKDPAQTELVRKRLEALKSNVQTRVLNPEDGSEVPDEPMIDSPVDRPLPDAAVANQPRGPDTSLVQSTPVVTRPAIAASPQPSPVTPDTSYYALGDQWSLGGLPGLSASNPLEPHIGSHRGRVGFLADNATERPNPANVGTSTAQNAPPPEILSPVFLESPETSRKDEDGQPNVPPPAGGRKRATAVDFLDAPASSPKRQMFSKDPISLVIEVSDDEYDIGLSSNLEGSQVGHYKGRLDEGGLKSFRDGPPLSDLASKGGSSSKFSTPPLKSQNSKGLAQTEEEIRLLQQKIAEMEERKRTKRSAQVLPAETASTDNKESPAGLTQAIEAQRQTLEDAGQELVARQESLAAAQSRMEETLETDQKNQANIVARVDAEVRAAERETSRAKRQARLQRKAQLEATLPQLNAQIEVARTRLEDMIKQQEEIEAEIQRGNEGRRALMKELDSLSKMLVEDVSPTPVPDSPLDDRPCSPVSDIPNEDMPKSLSGRSRSGSLLSSLHSAKRSSAAKSSDESAMVLGSPGDRSGDAPEVTMVEATMDISSSSADEGQIFESRQSPLDSPRPSLVLERRPAGEREPSDFSSAPMHEASAALDPAQNVDTPSQDESPYVDDDAMDVEEDEDYDPVLDFETAQDGAPESPIHIQSDESDTNTAPANDYDDFIETGEANEPMEQDRQCSSSQEDGEIHDEIRNDSDDYEPPEPSSPLNDVVTTEPSFPQAGSSPPRASSDSAASVSLESREDDGISLEASRAEPEREMMERQPSPEVTDEVSYLRSVW